MWVLSGFLNACAPAGGYCDCLTFTFWLQRDDPWNVRILPRVHFGAHPVGLDHIEPDSPQISVLHHYLGSWKVRGGWAKASAKFDLWRVWKLIKGKMYPQGGAATPPGM